MSTSATSDSPPGGAQLGKAGTAEGQPDLKRHVRNRVERLQQAYRAGSSVATAELARLRRGVAKPPGTYIELSGLTVAGLYPESYQLPDDPTDLEHAAYAAITLFAIHQQSQRNAFMHKVGPSFGAAAKQLAKSPQTSSEAVRRRFEALGTATSWDELTHHARGLIQQFRAAGIPFDYGQFAVDLFLLRQPERANSVRNRWGRDFYRYSSADDAAESTVTTTSTPESTSGDTE